MTNYSYRQLAANDVAPFKELLAMFADAFGDAASYQHRVPSDAYIARQLSLPHFIAIAAFHEGRVVGGLAAYQLDKFEQDRREIYIYDLAVAAPHRRKGVATGSIEALRTIAAARDVYVIFVQADLEDGPAIALYEKLGTKETAHHFDIAVPRSTRRA